MAKAFRDELGGAGVVLSDAERGAYRAAGMRRGLFSSLHWRTFVNALRAWRRGFRQTRVQGDPWQQGGALVFDRAGALVHQQLDRAAGDEVDVDALLRALAGAASCS